MLNLIPDLSPTQQPCILFLGAHSDDIEIGCGATVLHLANELAGAEIHWVVFSAQEARLKEATTSAEDFLSAFAGRNIEVHAFRDAYFPSSFEQIKDVFEKLQRRISPHLIFTHHKSDLHQDHRLIGELTWNTFRDHLILEYEIPKFDGGLGDPNFFLPVSNDLCELKIKKLLHHFDTQKDKQWFSPDLFSGLMRLRGLEGASPSGLAEAFYCRKAELGFRSKNDRK
jgi:LmbE family N-acetylglucosaminyl deacetylase